MKEEVTVEDKCPYAARPMHDEACVPFTTCEECMKHSEEEQKHATN